MFEQYLDAYQFQNLKHTLVTSISIKIPRDNKKTFTCTCSNKIQCTKNS